MWNFTNIVNYVIYFAPYKTTRKTCIKMALTYNENIVFFFKRLMKKNSVLYKVTLDICCNPT